MSTTWFVEADSEVYPSITAVRAGIGCGCVIAAGFVTHLSVAIIRWIGAPPALGLLAACLAMYWAPVALFAFWDERRKAAAIVKGVLLVTAVLTAVALAGAAIFWLAPREWLRADEESAFFTGRLAMTVQVVITFVLAYLLYRKTIPALAYGLDKLGLMRLGN